MKEKECSSCKKLLNLKYFSFRSDTNKYRGQCKKCHKGYLSNSEDRSIEADALFKKGKKKCSKCDTIKNLDSFSVDKITKTGYSSRCRSCIKLLNDLKDKREVKANRIKNIHSIDFEYALEVVSKTNCDICGIKFDNELKKNSMCLNVDHCHKTGLVRGALCGSCNRAIGLLKDDISILKSAIKYLESNR